MTDLKNDKSFKAPVTTNALSKHFDDHNGDFDTPQEYIRACLQRDPRALDILDRRQLDNLRDVLETMAPEIRQKMELLIRETQPAKKKPEKSHEPDAPAPE